MVDHVLRESVRLEASERTGYRVTENAEGFGSRKW